MSSLRAIWVDSDNKNGKLLSLPVYINIEQAECVCKRVYVYPIQFDLKIRFLFFWILLFSCRYNTIDW